MTDVSSPVSSPLRAWAQLVRLPNVFTVLADVGAAFLLVSGGAEPLGRFACVLLSGVALYWAGMILNDVFDIEVDREQRSARPLAAGVIPLSQAKLAGWGLLGVGVILAVVSGYLPAVTGSTWLPGAIGVALAVMIVAYDGPLKKTPLAPAAMGSCRVLSFLLGAAPCLVVNGVGSDQWQTLIPKHVLMAAVGFGVYIMGVTTMARREAVGGRDPRLPAGLVVLIVGVVLLAMAPRLALGGLDWQVDPLQQFPILIAMVAFPVVARGFRAVRDPQPQRIQTAIKIGVLSIIPLAAAFAMLGAGPVWGLCVFALVIPAILLASRLRVT